MVVAGRSPDDRPRRDGSARPARPRLGSHRSSWRRASRKSRGSSQFALDALGGRLDVLFHAAGISGRRFGDGPLDECSAEGWDAVLETNAKGLFLTNQAAVGMRAQPLDDFGLRGTVLNMGSVLAWSPSPDDFGTYAYAASKGAVRAMTLAAAARYARDRVRFNLLAPGPIDTPMAARAIGDPAIRGYLAAKQPMAGGPGTPDERAEGALYLCEPASRFVTGSILTIDGGWCVSEGNREAQDHVRAAAPS